MPIYQCYVPAGSLDADTRAELAEAITDIHCTVTVAPRGFAHVVFIEYGETSFFTAGKPNNLDCAPQEPQNGPVPVSPGSARQGGPAPQSPRARRQSCDRRLP